MSSSLVRLPLTCPACGRPVTIAYQARSAWLPPVAHAVTCPWDDCSGEQKMTLHADRVETHRGHVMN